MCTNAPTHTHLPSFLHSPCPLGMLGGIWVLMPQKDTSRLISVDGGSPFCPVFDCIYQFLIFLRSSFSRSHQRSGVPSGGLFLPLGLHLKTCLCGRCAGILHTCPNHWSLLCHSCSSTGSSPVLSRMVVFLTLSHKVRPRMSRRHLNWNVLNLFKSCCDTAHVSGPYNNTDITRVLKARSLVS